MVENRDALLGVACAGLTLTIVGVLGLESVGRRMNIALQVVGFSVVLAAMFWPS